jgi:lipopolysaccharide/colanic/teichoic acid biosynthesis glycosyltransferase
MFKRTLDIAASLAGVVALAPVWLAIAAAIKTADRGPVLYRGMRVGRFGVPFAILKFRTMVVDAERLGGSSTAGDDPRLTSVGRRLRRYKLDELPQLINVLRGDMSLVGPRPQVQWAVDTYTAQERTLLQVRPGLTDPASLRFANEAEILRGAPDPDRAYMELIHPEKMRLAQAYVANQSTWLDLQILARTVVCLFSPPSALRRRSGGE